MHKMDQANGMINGGGAAQQWQPNVIGVVSVLMADHVAAVAANCCHWPYLVCDLKFWPRLASLILICFIFGH